MKVLIVDDDYNIINMIKGMIPWENLGIDTILEAENGKLALDVVGKEDPDIIISDIEMPVMDGIAMVKALSEDKTHNPELIFLTCHADFEYAKMAVHYGVCEYLLKPFPAEELIAVLSKTIVRIKEKKKPEEPDTNAVAGEYAIKGFIRDLLDGNAYTQGGDIKGLAAKYGLEFENDMPCRIIAFGMDFGMAPSDFSRNDLTFVFKNVANEVLFGTVEERDFNFTEYYLADYYTAYHILNEKNYDRNDLNSKIRRIDAVLKSYIEVGITGVISGEVLPPDIAKTKREMEEVFIRSVTTSGGIYELEDAEKPTSYTKDKLALKEIEGYVRDRKKNEFLIYMRNYLEGNGASLDQTELKKLQHELMQVFYGFFSESGISSGDLLDDETGRKLYDSACLGSVYMMKYASYMYDYTVKEIDKVRESGSVTDKIKEYIKEHFAENIGRTEIAEYASLAPNYLSMIFHKDTGMTLREYINRCRVEEAKKLMDITNLNITEIALQVGFENISYFSTVFKKLTDVSPADYKNKRKADEF
ncbi:MAG: response regulator [Lachnospiraceae bacterium]|nr:response regulator [Lachnospiraceae bacterium]